MKTTISLLVLFALILGGGYALYSHNHPSPSYSASEMPAAPSTAFVSDSAATTTSSGTVAPTKTPAKAPSKAPGTYTSAEVASHNTSQSCWTSINGNVYDLTKWISQHPGGESAILSICGKDGTAAFEGQHSGNARPQQILATFKIGTLSA